MNDIRSLDLNLLRVLDALLRERSVTRAAARLSLSQPTVSGLLARLRDTFGDRLFVRTQRGLQPTPRALALADRLQRVLADAAALVEPARFDPAAARRDLVLSTTDYMQHVIGVPLIAALRRAAPGIRVDIRPLAIADLSGQMARGEVDLAITIPDFAAPDLTQRRLYRERYVAAVGRGHPLRAARPSLDAFCRFDHVVVSPAGGGFRGPVDAALARLKRRRSVAVSAPSFLLVPALLQATDLIAVLPERLVRGHARDLRLFPPPVDLPGFDVIAAWHKRVHDDPAHRWLRDLAASVAR